MRFLSFHNISVREVLIITYALKMKTLRLRKSNLVLVTHLVINHKNHIHLTTESLLLSIALLTRALIPVRNGEGGCCERRGDQKQRDYGTKINMIYILILLRVSPI